ncbi:MAG: hypothetical protein COB15_17195 [Flavobacteriales bacterium]|nr:MAG: hypothetical protein COB15_17195 [Flavobacteriales bacterium]
MEFKINQKLESSEYVKCIMNMTYRKPMMIIILIIGFFNLIWSALYLFPSASILFEGPPYMALAFGIGLIIISPASIYFGTKRNFNSNPRVSEPIEYKFTNDEIDMTGESFNSSMTWDKIFMLKETNSHVLIYHDQLIAQFINKKSLTPEQLNFFRSMVSRFPSIKNKMKKR